MTTEFRHLNLERGAVDVDARTVSLGVTSEEPVYRTSYGMNEVIDHTTEESIDMDFAKSGRMPMLLDHDPTRIVGVIENFRLDSESKSTKAVARFGRSAEATEAFNDVVDGIRSNVSVGYQVTDAFRDTSGDEPYMRVSAKILEVSLVSVPADQSEQVGVGRSPEDETPQTEVVEVETPTKRKETIMVEENTPVEEPTPTRSIDDILKAEDDRVREIDALATQYDAKDEALEAIREKRSVADFTMSLLERAKTQPHAGDVGMTEKETRRFSLARWIRAQANPTNARYQSDAGLELEAVETATRQNVYSSEGSTIPAEVFRDWNKRDVSVTDDGGGVGEDFLAGDFIEALRNRTAVMQAGATILNGLNADVKIPKQTGTSTAAWVASEGGNTSESELTLGSISLSPKGAGLYTEVTAQMLTQASGAGAIGIENIIRNDILASTSLLIDLGATAGSGSSGQPTGLNSVTGVNTKTLTTANTLTWAEAVDLESLCLSDNALFGNPGYILNATQVGLAKTPVKESGQATYVMDDDRINGHPVFISNHITAGSIYFSVDWSQLIMGFFGSGPSLLVDPYTNSASGTVRLRVLQFMDIACRHGQAFTHASGGS